MKSRSELAELSRAVEDRLVLSVYLARENEDPGKGPEWLRRLESALGVLRSDLEGHAPAELPDFDRSVTWVLSSLEDFGRILPHEGWVGVATEDRLWHAEALPFKPHETVRWTKGACVAPYVRALEVGRPAILAVLSSMHASLYRFDGHGLSEPMELHVESPEAEAADVGVSKRAARASGMRGTTRTDYVKRTRDEGMRRHRRDLEQALVEMAGEEGVVVLGGTRKAMSFVAKELGDGFAARVAEAPQVAFDTSREELAAQVRAATSRLTEEKQAELVELCADPHQGTSGWNETYRALAAGAVDTLLLAREMIESSADDAERLVRLALAQGSRVEEVGGHVGARLSAELGGIAARLRFVPASLMA